MDFMFVTLRVFNYPTFISVRPERIPGRPWFGRLKMSTKRRAALIFIFITVLLDILALGVIIPVLPKLVEDFLGGNTAKAAQVIGLFGTIWALMQFFFTGTGCALGSLRPPAGDPALESWDLGWIIF